MTPSLRTLHQTYRQRSQRLSRSHSWSREYRQSRREMQDNGPLHSENYGDSTPDSDVESLTDDCVRLLQLSIDDRRSPGLPQPSGA